MHPCLEVDEVRLEDKERRRLFAQGTSLSWVYLEILTDADWILLLVLSFNQCVTLQPYLILISLLVGENFISLTLQIFS